MNKLQYTVTPQHNSQLGSGVTSKGLWFGSVFDHSENCGVILYPENTVEHIKIYFPADAFCGKVCQVEVSFNDPSYYKEIMKCNDNRGLRYLLFDGDKIYPDPYMKDFDHGFNFGVKSSYFSRINPDCINESYDKEPLSFEKSIFYMLHVRGYTAHESSRVRNKGTFEGLKSKLTYIKKLGVTSLILMPVYEFDEIISTPSYMQYDVSKDSEPQKEKVNFWGYCPGYYYVPKMAFSATGNPVNEFENLVDSVHDNGLEVILQFCLNDIKSASALIDILKYWKYRFKVDGFQIIGSERYAEDILADPFLFNTKFIFDQPVDNSDSSINPHHGYLNYKYLTDMRSFLKADPNTSYNAAMHIKNNDKYWNPINFVARQDTMRIADIVSYNEKHNEANGENGTDGTDFNFSWNCGFEGPTKKRGINELREKQIKNALAFVMLSKGAPLIYGGDEFANTQYGNNNPYNQDNEIGYIKWNNNRFSKAILEFCKELIEIRKAHSSVYEVMNLTGRDPKSYGFPDFSLHGQELWRADLGPTSHGFGVIFNDRYSSTEDDRLIYVIFNMHWETMNISLPKLKTQGKWEKRISSDSSSVLDENHQKISLAPRSIMILETQK